MSFLDLPVLKSMLAVPSSPFDSKEYLFEIKLDGYRCLCYLNGGVKLFSRNGVDMTMTFPELAGLNSSVPGRPAVFDGENNCTSKRKTVLSESAVSWQAYRYREDMRCRGQESCHIW